MVNQTVTGPLLEAMPKHSRFGIASFVVSIVDGVVMLALFTIAGVQASSTPGRIADRSVAAIIGSLFIGACCLNLIGIVFAVVGLFEKNRRKVFSVLGLIFNVAVILLSAGLIGLGLYLQNR